MAELVPANSAAYAAGLLLGVFGSVAAILAGTLGAALARTRRGRDRGGDDHRCVGIDLEDAEAEDAVGDLQVVVERVEQVARGLEPHPAVVRLGAAVDFVGHLAQAPAVL